MTAGVDTITATLDEGAGHDLGNVSGSVTMDEGHAPHVTAQITIGLTDDETLLGLLDPREARRVTINTSQTFPDSFIPDEARSFDLGLRERTIDYEAGTVTLQLASDEELLADYAPLSDDKTPRTHEASLAAVVDYVLDAVTPGAALEPGPDADVTAYWPVTNVIPNPTGQVDAGNWQIGTGAGSLAGITMSSPLPPLGNRAVTWTATINGDSNVIASASPAAYRVTPGKSYVFAVYLCTGTTPREARAVIQWWGDSGSVVVASSFGSNVTSDVTQFRRIHVIATAPPGAQYAYPYINTQANSAGQSHFAALAMLYEGDELIPAFLGDTSPASGYTYAWQGGAHLSPSTRTPDLERPPESLTWQAGRSAWEFLQPLFQAAGFRLFCNEARQWRLVNGAEYIAPGTTQLAYAVQLTSAADSISRDDGEWFDAAIVRYKWTDPDGIQREVIEAFAPPDYTRPRTFDIDRAYVGPGFAEYAVKRATGKGRTLALATMSRYAVTPSQVLRATLPNTPELLGVVRAVSWDLETAVMTVASRGLTETPANAIDLLEDTIDDLVGTIDSL